jgi:hypothetical protein
LQIAFGVDLGNGGSGVSQKYLGGFQAVNLPHFGREEVPNLIWRPVGNVVFDLNRRLDEQLVRPFNCLSHGTISNLSRVSRAGGPLGKDFRFWAFRFMCDGYLGVFRSDARSA